MKVEAIDHLHLLVPDLKQVGALFGALIGGEFTEPYGGEPWNAWSVWYGLGGMEIMEPIRQMEPILGGHPSDRMGIFGIAFRVTDLDARVPDVEALGLRLRSRMGSEETGFGKWIRQAQFDPSDSFGAVIEIAQRELPDDPLYSAFRQIIDHVEFFVHDLPRAVGLFSALTGWEFPAPVTIDQIKARSTLNALGLKITQPVSADSPVADTLARLGEGIRVLALATSNLEASIAKAQAVGLRLVSHGCPNGLSREVQFDPADTFGLVLKLVERHAD
ncbi:MAG: methylmalonyl-CoA epimerase [Deltaproteobacteria bacterium]|nr:methylmalonyl-CoA epimerase [Deltaproteobacteria bacterium]